LEFSYKHIKAIYVRIPKITEMDHQNRLKNSIKHKLKHVNIQHATLEFETKEEKYVDLNLSQERDN